MTKQEYQINRIEVHFTHKDRRLRAEYLIGPWIHTSNVHGDMHVWRCPPFQKPVLITEIKPRQPVPEWMSLQGLMEAAVRACETYDARGDAAVLRELPAAR